MQKYFPLVLKRVCENEREKMEFAKIYRATAGKEMSADGREDIHHLLEETVRQSGKSQERTLLKD